jgi:hypothetical protein
VAIASCSVIATRPGARRCARLGDAGIRVVQTPNQSPNANAYPERFVRAIKQECLSRVIPFGERPSPPDDR